MKVLIQDTEPDRLAAWLSHMSRPGRVCHLANTADQARFLLLSDPYDMVLLENSGGDTGAEDLSRLARQGNPACKVIDLPQMPGVEGLTRAERAAGAIDMAEPATADRGAAHPAVGSDNQVRWRRIGAGPKRVVAEASGVTWRVFRRQGVLDEVTPAVDTGDAVAESPAAKLPSAPALAPRSPRPRGQVKSPEAPGAEAAALSIGQGLRQRAAVKV